ncbi:MAG: hypothetical protein FWF50_05885 [Defluviitaleaceae bacterium]|nr:hypothetical protein [Defluviitaleaceae bacterium]
MITFESAINRLAERLSDRSAENSRVQLQRRNQVVDIYGQEFTRQGEKKVPASFYISISPDLIYFERFEFKVIIEGLRIPIGGLVSDNNQSIGEGIIQTSRALVNVKPEGLRINPSQISTGESKANITIGGNTEEQPPEDEDEQEVDAEIVPLGANESLPQISQTPHTHTIDIGSLEIISESQPMLPPNTHSHKTEPHYHTIEMTAGVSEIAPSATSFSMWVWIEDIPEIEDITGLIERRRPGRAGSSGNTQTASNRLPAMHLRVNLTPYFKAQFPNNNTSSQTFSGRWLDGEGIFPTEALYSPPIGDDNTSQSASGVASLEAFDLLEAVAYMDDRIREKILKPGYKRFDIEGDGAFTATLVNYLKYSHVNR